MKKLIILIFSIFVYANEAQIALDLAKVNEYLSKISACSNNDFKGCDEANNINKITYIKEAKDYINDECKAKNMAACYTISTFSDDDYTIFNALRLACQNHFELACTKLILNYEQNSTKALKIIKAQCDNENNQNSCYATARYYKGFLDKENAIKYAHIACNKNFFNACIFEASVHLENNDTKKAFNLLEQTCNKGYEEACFAGANAYLNMGKFKLSKKFLEKSCNLGNQISCKKLSGF